MRNWKKLLCLLTLSFAGGFAAIGADDYNWAKPDGVMGGCAIELFGANNMNISFIPVLSGENKPVNCLVQQTGKEESRAFRIRADIRPQEKGSSDWITATFAFKIRSRDKKKKTIQMLVWPYNNGFAASADGPHELPDRGFMGIAEISSKEVKFPNKGFFKNPKQLKEWGINAASIKDKKQHPEVLTDKDLDVPGKKYVRTCQPIRVNFTVLPETETTITVRFKPLEHYKPLR